MARLTQFHAEGKIQDEFDRWRRRELDGRRFATPGEIQSFLDYIENERSELLDFKYVANGGDKRSLIKKWLSNASYFAHV